ncbi:MAG: hypothetical protein R3B47_19075 [Bacteroidia bacterium]
MDRSQSMYWLIDKRIRDGLSRKDALREKAIMKMALPSPTAPQARR